MNVLKKRALAYKWNVCGRDGWTSSAANWKEIVAPRVLKHLKSSSRNCHLDLKYFRKWLWNWIWFHKTFEDSVLVKKNSPLYFPLKYFIKSLRLLLAFLSINGLNLTATWKCCVITLCDSVQQPEKRQILMFMVIFLKEIRYLRKKFYKSFSVQ